VTILFTGASSFTGYWFTRELVAEGHEVVAVLRGSADRYEGIRRRRVELLHDVCEVVEGCSFGDPAFLALVAGRPVDVLCHHAAETHGYREDAFDVSAALAANTRSLRDVLAALRASGGAAVVLTGTVFEEDEGAGDGELPAFSAYGLSKSLTFRMFRHYCRAAEVPLGKFVVPNPFGPLEESRFTAYLIRSWQSGETPVVKTPDYVRDNIHVSLLARAYAVFVRSVVEGGTGHLGPSGYRERQGEFAQRVARELGPRLGVATPLDLRPQQSFPEPRVRVNTDLMDVTLLGWDEASAWDELAGFYATATPSLSVVSRS
jgi:nucleoside-diphosphate-sugar epimerase